MSDNLNKLTDEDAIQILEHLRSKTREFGLGELDADIGGSLNELRIGSGVAALERYFGDLFKFLKVFDEGSIESTTSELNRYLDHKWSWQLLPGGDPEEKGSSENPYFHGIQDMTKYQSVNTLRHSLAHLMRRLGIDVPNDDDNDSSDNPELETDR